jgi:hypothetical protein
MILFSIAIFWLAGAIGTATVILAMKATELADAVSRNTAAVNGLASSVDAAVAVLINVGAVTPDADIVPLIAAIDANTQTAVNAKAKLDAALAPPTP